MKNIRLAARKFNGKVYELLGDWKTKRDAKKSAVHYRRQKMHFIRVVKEADGWAVYGRLKKRKYSK